jgi:hypothetical protein
LPRVLRPFIIPAPFSFFLLFLPFPTFLLSLFPFPVSGSIALDSHPWAPHRGIAGLAAVGRPSPGETAASGAFLAGSGRGFRPPALACDECDGKMRSEETAAGSRRPLTRAEKWAHAPWQGWPSPAAQRHRPIAWSLWPANCELQTVRSAAADASPCLHSQIEAPHSCHCCGFPTAARSRALRCKRTRALVWVALGCVGLC